MSYFSFASNELERKGRHIQFQLYAIGVLILAGVGVAIFSSFFPTFFIYPYLNWGGWESVWRFWPMFLWVTIITAFFSRGRGLLSPRDNSALLGLSMISSTLAGIWEELGYRWIFICYAMISIVIMNWIFGAGIGWFLTIVLGITTITLLVGKKFPHAISAAVGTYLAYLFAQNANLIYWFYENILMVIVHAITFGQMDSVFYSGHDKIFLFGAILANAWFRDGHKYQGWFGYTNSWFCGMALLYATVTYGLMTAVAIHVIYDVIYSIVVFLVRTTE